MKKAFALLTVLALLMAGCGNKAQESEQKFTEDALVGTYADYSYTDTTSLRLSLQGIAATSTLTIEQADSELIFNDSNYKGTCDLSEDGTVGFHREEVVAQNQGLHHSLNTMMQQQPTVSYFMYKDYLIADWDMPINEIDGELPNGKYTYCSIRPAHTYLTDYTLGFFDDGTCEMESTGLFGANEEYFAGTYEFDGKVVLLTFTEGDWDGQELRGTCKMALYIDDGKVHSSIYKKVS